MREVLLSIIFYTLTFTFAKCHLIWNESKQLHPVQGLYVKPSIDGTTGDLYVAATEDNGVETQWLTDQPINFLPAETKQQTTAVPVSLTSSVTTKSSPNEETITKQKQTVVTSPPIQYAYALPFPGSEGGVLAPYPYAIAPDSSHAPTCPEGTPISHYSAFQYFYPQMLSALANAMNTINGDGIEKGAGNSPLAQFWSGAYSYPYQYVMVDPKAWAQSQKDTTQTSTSSEKA